MASRKKVLYVCQQVSPYVPATKYSVAALDMLQGIHERGCEIRTFMPRYGNINERRNQLHEVIRLSGMNLIINDTDHQLIIKVASIPTSRVQVYFIDNEDYFSRKKILKDDDGNDFADNDERAIFFARGVLETVKKLRWDPSIVHCQGWFSGFVAAYLRYTFADDPIFAGVKIVVSLDGDTFSSPLDECVAQKIADEGVDGEELKFLKEPSYENFYRFVLTYADGVIISSADVPENIAKLARECGKPILERKPSVVSIAEDEEEEEKERKELEVQSENNTFYDECVEFYDKI